jgi:DNA-binding transcriptional LysR family regulator
MMNYAQLARIDINLLVLFDVVFRERHLGRAAHRLGLTTSAVSHGLNRLRRMLNDPLFLRSPRGVVPTERATDLADSISDILARVGSVMESARPFEAKQSRRRFTIGAPDALSAIFLPSLLERVRLEAPHVGISVREAFPAATAFKVERVWESVRQQLEARTMDVAVIPAARVAPRFERKRLYETRFVVTARRGHPFLRKPTLEHFCSCKHVVVSQVGDPRGFIDILLEKQKLSRRVEVTVPTFLLALVIVAGSDLLAAVPRNLLDVHGKRLGLAFTDVPIDVGELDPAYVVASRAALLDAGVGWLFSMFEAVNGHY